MTTYYVDSAAGTQGNGLTQDKPLNSLTAVNALNLAPGDSVLFKAGSSFSGSTPWSGILNITADGTADKPITFGAYGTGAAPTFANTSAQWSSSISFTGASYVVLQGISVVDGMQAGISVDAATSHVTIQNVDISHAGTGIILDGTANTVLNNKIHDLKMVVNTPTSVNNNDDFGATAVIISGTGHTISGNQIDNAKAMSYDYGVDGGAFEFWQSASNVHVFNNVVTNTAGFMEMGGQPGVFSNILIDHNVSYNSGSFVVIHNDGGAFGASISGVQVVNNTIANTNNLPGSMSTIWLDGPATVQQFQFSENVVSLNTGDSVFEQHGNYHFDNVFDLKSKATHLYNNWDMTLNTGEVYAAPSFANLASGDLHIAAGGVGSTLGAYAGGSGASSPITIVQQAPVVTSQISDQADTVGKAFNLNVVGNFNDANGDALTYTATQANGSKLPTWLHFNNGVFSGTPGAGDVASLQLKVTATDSTNLAVSDTFGLTVITASQVIGPVVHVTDLKPAAGSTLLASQLFSANDATGTIQTYEIVDWWNTPTSGHFVFAGASKPESTTFQVAASDLASLSYIAGTSHDLLAVRAFDGTTWSSWGTFNLDPQAVNLAPAVATQIADTQDKVGTAFSLNVTGNFSDPNGDALTYTATQASGAALPSWLHFSNGVFSGTPGAGDVASLQLKVTAADPSHLSVSDTFSLTVASAQQAPVVANLIADQQDTVGTAFSLNVASNFSDPNGDALTYTATQANGTALPNWLHFSNGVFSGTPHAGDIASLQVKVTASDPSHLSTSDTFALTVAATQQAPVVANQIADQKDTVGTAFSLNVASNFSDPNGDVLTYSATQANGAALPSWLHFTNGVFSGTPGAGDVASLQLKVTAADPSHLSVSDTFGLAVTAPAAASSGSSVAALNTGLSASTSLSVVASKPVAGTVLHFSDLVSLQGSPNEIKFVDWWNTPGSGHFVLNGVIQPKATAIIISADKVAGLDYVVGSSGLPGQDLLQFQASNDSGNTWGTNGTNWAWATVSIVPL